MGRNLLGAWVKGLLAVLVVAWWTGAVAQDHGRAVAKFVSGDLYTFDQTHLEALSRALKAAHINTIANPLAWSVVEPEPGRFDFSPYRASLDYLRDQGFRLVVVLDTSGRNLVTQEQQMLEQLAIPRWFYQNYLSSIVKDSLGQRGGYNLDIHDHRHRPLVEAFYQRALDFLEAHYGDQIHAVVPGMNHELEIKFAQTHYAWQSYSAAAVRDYRRWQARRGFDRLWHWFDPPELPIFHYANEIKNGRAVESEDFYAFMRFREAALKEYVCGLTELIRRRGFPAGAYFGQSFTSHDAIYALGVIEEVVPCFDIVTVDYNYYDGWGLELEPYTIPLLVNYAHHLGYPQVAGGVYIERLYEPDDILKRQHWPVVRRTFELLGDVPFQGLEVGNLRPQDLELLADLALERFAVASPLEEDVAQRPSIALLASKWTYYLWHGERSFERNIMQDALLASYRLLRESGRFKVAVLGEKSLLEGDLSSYRAILIPHQTTLTPEAVAVLKAYHSRGGALVQDVQLNAFGLDGVPNSDWLNELFGIGGLEWRHEAGDFDLAHRPLRLPRQERLYFTYTALAPAPGYRLLVPLVEEPEIGLMVRGPRSLVLGFLPQLVEGGPPGTPGRWAALFVEAVAQLAQGVAMEDARGELQGAVESGQPAPHPVDDPRLEGALGVP